MDECAQELENTCNSFIRDDCEYQGDLLFERSITDAHACQKLLQTLGEVYQAEYFVYNSTSNICKFFSTTASECDGYSGPKLPDIDECSASTTTTSSTSDPFDTTTGEELFTTGDPSVDGHQN